MKIWFGRYWVLILIICLGIGVRFYKLGLIPMGLFSDEIDAGYNAWSFWITGRDYNGNWWPVHFESGGDYRAFLFIWSMIPAVASLGLSPFSVRVGSAVLGVLGIWAVYLMVSEGLKQTKDLVIWSKRVGLLAAGIMVILPWHLHYSRIGFEVTLMVFLLILSVFTFMKGLINQRWMMLSVLLFGINSYSYNISKMFSPMLLVICVAVYRNKLAKITWKYKSVLLGLFLLVLMPLVVDSVWGGGSNRFVSLNIFQNPKMVAEINYLRGQDGLNNLMGKVMHNKVGLAIKMLVSNYVTAFSTDFLFFSGDELVPRHSVPGYGLLYVWMLPLIVLGLFEIGINYKNKFYQLILFWLLLAPVPSSLTMNGGFHVTRLAVLMVPIVVISAFGSMRLWQVVKLKILRYSIIGIYIIWMGLEFGDYEHYYLNHYSQINYQWWDYGLRETVLKAEKVKGNYDEIVFMRDDARRPYLHYWFNAQIDPRLIQDAWQYNQNPLDRLGKVVFGERTMGFEHLGERLLYITEPLDAGDDWKKVGEIASPNSHEDDAIWVLLEPVGLE